MCTGFTWQGFGTGGLQASPLSRAQQLLHIRSEPAPKGTMIQWYTAVVAEQCLQSKDIFLFLKLFANQGAGGTQEAGKWTQPGQLT